MSDATLRQYVEYVYNAYNAEDALSLARAFSLSDVHVLSPELWESYTVAPSCAEPGPLLDLMNYHLLTLKALHVQNFLEVFHFQSDCVAIVVRLLANQPGTNWMLPVMFAISLDLRIAAHKADMQFNSRGILLENAANSLMACYRVCVEDPEPDPAKSKVQGALYMANHLLRMYFKINKFDLCHALISAVEPIILRGSFSLAQQVIFRYLVGRLAVLEADFITANEQLSFAFMNCPVRSHSSKRLILSYLLPVKLVLGSIPTFDFIMEYNLPRYWNLLTAVREGNIQRFDEIYDANQIYLTENGLLDTMETLRLLVIRTIIKMVYNAQKTNVISLDSFQAGLEMMSQHPVSISDTASIIGTLIYNNLIKAYLSQERELVYFNSEDTFPAPVDNVIIDMDGLVFHPMD